MPADELPDDPRSWPADPYELFGVLPGCMEADLKRAYFRLVRRFKPEHSPEQFRRIREAYEFCQQRHAWYRPSADAAPSMKAVPPTPVARDDPKDRPPAERDREPKADPAAPHAAPAMPVPRVEEADRLWALAAEGDAEAYIGLCALSGGMPDRTDLPLRLYWLLAVYPHFDAEKTRHEWLYEALSRSRLCGPALELYRRESEVDPRLALAAPYDGLLDGPWSFSELFPLVQLRTRAAGKADIESEVWAALNALRARSPMDRETEWLAHLIAVKGWNEWFLSDPIDAIVRAELELLQHLQLSHAHYFDRIDRDEHRGTVWRCASINRLPAPVRLLVMAARCDAGCIDAGDIARAAAALAEDAGNSLALLDGVLDECGPYPVELLLEVIWYRYRSEGGLCLPEFPAELIRGLFRNFSAGHRTTNYDRLRSNLLPFLVAEAIDPLELSEALLCDPNRDRGAVGRRLAADRNLRTVWTAIRLQRG